MIDTCWEQPGNAGAIPLHQLPNFILSHGHFTRPPCGFQFASQGVGVVWEFQSLAQRGGLYVVRGILFLVFPQAPFLRTNLVHGRGQKSEYEVRLSFLFGHILPHALPAAFFKAAWKLCPGEIA